MCGKMAQRIIKKKEEPFKEMLLKKAPHKTVKVEKNHPLFEPAYNGFTSMCKLFGIKSHPKTFRIKENAISGFDPKTKQITSLIFEDDKTYVLIHSAPRGKPVKLLDERMIS